MLRRGGVGFSVDRTYSVGVIIRFATNSHSDARSFFGEGAGARIKLRVIN
jgi:hypothetical protein